MTTRVLRLLPLCTKNSGKHFHSSCKLSAFYERDRKAGYQPISDFEIPNRTVLQRIREGYKIFGEEMGKLKEEIINRLHMDPITKYRLGEVDVVYKFDGTPESLNKWIVSCDSDYGEGKSQAKLELTPHGTGLFSGVLDTTPLRDGRRVSSGYCNVRALTPLKSFFREAPHNWNMYTHLILRVRGDGRNYMLNIHVDNMYDVMWNDLHHYVLHTRGGPYWQYVKIPFSKFYLSNRGRVQDIQHRFKTGEVTGVSFTASDQIPGEFNLEIHFVGVERDETFIEKFAYELYVAPFPHYI